MQRLNRDMLERYDIISRRPERLNAVQFGTDEALLGIVDRLIDEAGGMGIACLRPRDIASEGADPAALLREQDGLYTVLVRGYEDEQPVNREVVVQAFLSAPEDDAELEALARQPDLELGILDLESPDSQAELALATRLLSLRHGAGLDGLALICVGDALDCAERALETIAALSEGDSKFEAWLRDANAFYTALVEGFALRADAREAARLCETMNYADGMIHLSEPRARLMIQAPTSFGKRLGWDLKSGIGFTDDIAPAMDRKHRLFDAGLFAAVAPGWLLGCDALADCMKHEALRKFVGNVYYEELLPRGAARETDAPYVIETFERFENPLNQNALLRVGAPLLRRFERGALPLMRRWADEHFEPPRYLSFALAATIMLYAGARPNDQGRYEVIRGTQIQTLADDPGALAVFSTLSHDMPPEALAYAALADRELWHGADLREIDGLESRVALDIARLQRQPGFIPE